MLKSWKLLPVVLAAFFALPFCGCRSAGKPASAQFASVEIEGNTPGQIRDVLIAVFQEQGFRVARTGLSNLVFEKEGSKLDNLAYRDWISGPQIWIRVKTSIVPVSEAFFRLECQAYAVQDKGQSIFEEEIKLSNFSGRRYQKLLDEVARRLGGKKKSGAA